MKSTIFVIIAIMSFQVFSDGLQCKKSPNIVEACFETRGRISAANGNPGLRMWKVGTKRILGILGYEDPIIPNKLKEYLGFGVEIYGDYLVCPFTKEKKNHMQMVCVESASNIRVEDYRESTEHPKIRYVK